MKEIFDIYKNKLDNFIVELKSEVKLQSLNKELLENIRIKLNQWGKNNLNLMYMELKSAIEAKSALDENKKKSVLERASSLTEYGLYVAPIDLIQGEQNNAQSLYIAALTVLGACALQKIIFKKFKFFNSTLLGLLTFAGSSTYFNKYQDNKESVLSYIDDAKEWLLTAFENIYKTFKELD